MTVERLRSDQWERLRDVRLRAVLAEPALYGWAWERESGFGERHWRMRLSGGAWWVVGTEDGDVGVVSALQEPGATEWERLIVGLWVEAGSRRRGHGRALVEAVARSAVADGATALTAWLPAEGAPGFWAALGFSATGEAVAAPRAPGGEEARWHRDLTGGRPGHLPAE